MTALARPGRTLAIRTLAANVRKRLQDLCAAERGNVLITFALTLIPIIAFVGAAVDYSRANSAKAAMQAAVDSTALMLSKDAQSVTTAQLNQKATAYFNALFTRTDVSNIAVSPTFTTPAQGSFRIDVTATGQVATTFTKVLAQQTLNINVDSQVLWGIKKLELALALDNTGSMSSSSKMTELKKAAHTLLDTMKKAAKSPGDVKVAIIPFDTTVNLGTSYKDNTWFDVSCSALGSPPGCKSSTWKSYWEGCVRDRTQPYDVQDTSPTASAATLYPIYDCGTLTKLMPLSYDWTALNAKIDAMQPNGNTNVTIGLVWAWHALTSNTPLIEATAPAPDVDKVIILLTDGDNTEAWNNSNNTKITNQSTIDARTALACTNIKAANIKIYTVRVIDGNASLLTNCASSPNMYFNVQNASELNSVFSAIAQNLANLRLAK
jgi:Flp pilus assembly protein TadG